jgi:hypothetical protein
MTPNSIGGTLNPAINTCGEGARIYDYSTKRVIKSGSFNVYSFTANITALDKPLDFHC